MRPTVRPRQFVAAATAATITLAVGAGVTLVAASGLPGARAATTSAETRLVAAPGAAVARADGVVPETEADAAGAAPGVTSGPSAQTAGDTSMSSAGAAPAASSSNNRVVMNPATSWALLVGVSHYDSPTHPTYGGLGDVAAFHDALRAAGWPDSHILTLTDQGASADAIRSSMQWLVSHSNPGTFSLFHYSGHVLQSSGHTYLWGVDNQFLSENEVGSRLGALQGRAWIDIAGCESAIFNQGLSSAQRFYSSSSMGNEKSYEEPSWGQSVWTGLTVARGMQQHQAAAPDGSVSIQGAVRWAQQQAPSMTTNQSHGPQHPYAMGGDGEWYLGPAVAPPPAKAPAGGSVPPSGQKGGGAPPPPSSPCPKSVLNPATCHR